MPAQSRFTAPSCCHIGYCATSPPVPHASMKMSSLFFLPQDTRSVVLFGLRIPAAVITHYRSHSASYQQADSSLAEAYEATMAGSARACLHKRPRRSLLLSSTQHGRGRAVTGSTSAVELSTHCESRSSGTSGARTAGVWTRARVELCMEGEAPRRHTHTFMFAFALPTHWDWLGTCPLSRHPTRLGLFSTPRSASSHSADSSLRTAL